MKTLIKIGLLLSIFSFVWAPHLRGEVIRVGVVIEPPFVYEVSEEQYEGLSIDLWESMALDGGLEYEYLRYNDELAIIRALAYDEIDLSINPNGITPRRLQLLDATQPFYITNTGIAVPRVKRRPLFDFISNFFSYNFIRIIGVLGLIIFAFGTLQWLVERKRNRHQFRPGLMGLFDGLWWSAVTMTTVGYGDKAPKTIAGRAIAIVWMFTAIIIISGFTATIASTLTVSSFQTTIDNIDDLRVENSIGTVEESLSANFLIENDITPDQKFKSVREGLRALIKQDSDFLVHDKTELRYLIDQLQLEDEIILLPVNFNRNYKNFLLPKNSQLTEVINPLLLSQINTAKWPLILKQYQLSDQE